MAVLPRWINPPPSSVVVDTDVALAANSDTRVPSQKAAKTYIDAHGGGTAVEVATHAATSKATPVDADELPLADSAASYGLKKLTWANLKATLKTYLDTFYPSGSGTSTGTNTGDQTSVSGNAGTATALQTGRTIDGQTFDGTANVTVIAPGIHAAPSKTTPVDADEFGLADSAASNVLKKFTGTNLKAYLKTYFDGIYVATVFGRTGAVVAAPGDYLASQVTNAADKISSAVQAFAGGITSTHATQGIGYATGAGGAVTQATSRVTSVTLNKICGTITTFTNSTSGTKAFTVNNSTVAAGDTIQISLQTNTGNVTAMYATNVQAGSFTFNYFMAGADTTAYVFNFAIVRAVSS